MDEYVGLALTAWSKDWEGVPMDAPGIHPTEEALEGYCSVAADGYLDVRLTEEQKETRAHVFVCEACQKRLTSQRLCFSEKLVLSETQELAEISTDAPGLVVVLADSNRAGWVRAIACDYLGLCGGGRIVSEALHAAKSDTEAEVREAAEEAQIRLHKTLARFTALLTDTHQSMPLTHRFTEAFVDLSAFANADTIEGWTGDGLHYELSRDQDQLGIRVMADDAGLHESEVTIIIVAMDEENQCDVLLCDKKFTLVPMSSGFGFIERLGPYPPLTNCARLGLFVQKPDHSDAACSVVAEFAY